MLGNIILLNNAVVAGILSPLLLLAIYPRVKAAGLRYDDILAEGPARPRPVRLLGLALVVIATVAGLIAGNLLSTGQIAIPALAADPPGTRAAQVGVGLLPIIILLLIGVALL